MRRRHLSVLLLLLSLGVTQAGCARNPRIPGWPIYAAAAVTTVGGYAVANYALETNTETALWTAGGTGLFFYGGINIGLWLMWQQDKRIAMDHWVADAQQNAEDLRLREEREDREELRAACDEKMDDAYRSWNSGQSDSCRSCTAACDASVTCNCGGDSDCWSQCSLDTRQCKASCASCTSEPPSADDRLGCMGQSRRSFPQEGTRPAEPAKGMQQCPSEKPYWDDCNKRCITGKYKVPAC